jgi:hypothetical protein
MNAEGIVEVFRADDWKQAAKIGGTIVATEAAGWWLAKYAPRAAGALAILSLVSLEGDSPAAIESNRRSRRVMDFLEENVPGAVGSFGPVRWLRDYQAYNDASRLLDDPKSFLKR